MLKLFSVALLFSFAAIFIFLQNWTRPGAFANNLILAIPAIAFSIGLRLHLGRPQKITRAAASNLPPKHSAPSPAIPSARVTKISKTHLINVV